MHANIFIRIGKKRFVKVGFLGFMFSCLGFFVPTLTFIVVDRTTKDIQPVKWAKFYEANKSNY